MSSRLRLWSWTTGIGRTSLSRPCSPHSGCLDGREGGAIPRSCLVPRGGPGCRPPGVLWWWALVQSCSPGPPPAGLPARGRPRATDPMVSEHPEANCEASCWVSRATVWWLSLCTRPPTGHCHRLRELASLTSSRHPRLSGPGPPKRVHGSGHPGLPAGQAGTDWSGSGTGAGSPGLDRARPGYAVRRELPVAVQSCAVECCAWRCLDFVPTGDQRHQQ